jgi:hypothetical protein
MAGRVQHGSLNAACHSTNLQHVVGCHLEQKVISRDLQNNPKERPAIAARVKEKAVSNEERVSDAIALKARVFSALVNANVRLYICGSWVNADDV